LSEFKCVAGIADLIKVRDMNREENGTLKS